MLPSTPPPLDERNYRRFRELVRERYGLDYPAGRRTELAYRLNEALTASRYTSPDDYYYALLAPDPNPEMERLISVLTVGETYFFRNRHHFAALTRSILPELVAARATGGRRLRFWSAGCATGEEPYSLAIVLRELIPDLERWNITILATDVDRQALRKAEAGVYRSRAFREMDPALRDRYFRAHGEKGQTWLLDHAIRRMVTFAHLNLTENSHPSSATNTGAMDLILCRNVTIYFPAEVTRQVAERFYRALILGGWLLVGASELNQEIYRQFEIRNFPGAVIYRRPDRTDTGAVARPASSIELPAPPPVRCKTSEVSEDLGGLARVVPPESAPSPEPDPASDRYQRALALQQAGKVETARIALQELIDQNPTFTPACVSLARILADQGHLAEARGWCERALQQNKVFLEAHYILAQVCQELGQPEEAIGALKKTLFLDRDHVSAYLLLSTLYQRRGQMRQARKALENAADILRCWPPEKIVPESDGTTAGQLLEIVEARLRMAHGGWRMADGI